MSATSNQMINENAVESAITEIKLYVNRRLYERKAITEEMFVKAKEMILKGTT